MIFESALLIEDNPSHALLIKRVVRRLAKEVRHVLSLREAFDHLQTNEVDVIISDLNLPDSPAESTVPSLLERSGAAPVVVLTSSTALSDAVQAMRAGAKDFIVKSFDDEFAEMVGLSLARLGVLRSLEAERLRLEREMGALQSAIEHGRDALAVVLDDGSISYANSAYRLFAQRCGVEDAGSLFRLFTSGVKRARTVKDGVEANLLSLPPGGVWSTEITLEGDEAEAFEFTLSACTEDLERRRFVVWIRDVTEARRRERFQREILSATTHDLKGPLGAVLLSTELLRAEPLDPAKVGPLALRIAASTQGALNLIDEFLSARRIQAGAFLLKPEAVDPQDLVVETLGEFQTIAEARGIRLEREEAPELPLWPLDRLGVKRVLGNLLSNALKFTPKGGVVRVETRAKKELLSFTVKDSGTGMEAAEVHKIFERYSRLDRHAGYAGSGIGLFVVKSIVHAHGGSVEVTSKLGEGASFVVHFPATPPVNERGELISLDFT